MRFITGAVFLSGALHCNASHHADINTAIGTIVALQGDKKNLTGRLVCKLNRYHDGETINIQITGSSTYWTQTLNENDIKMLEAFTDRRCLSREGRERLDRIAMTDQYGRPALFKSLYGPQTEKFTKSRDPAGFLMYNKEMDGVNKFKKPPKPQFKPSQYFLSLQAFNETAYTVPIRDEYLAQHNMLILVPLSILIQKVEAGENPVSYHRSWVKDREKLKREIEPARLVDFVPR